MERLCEIEAHKHNLTETISLTTKEKTMFSKKPIDTDLDLYMIYDTKVGAYEAPHFCINQLDAIRSLSNLYRDPQQGQNKYLVNSEDYQLFKIASISKKTGEVYPTNPEHIANCHEIKSMVLQERMTSLKNVGSELT